MRALAIALALVVVLLAGALAALAWFPAPLLRAGLAAAGIAAVRFEDLALGADALELRGLQIGAPPEHRVARLQIRYRLRDLVRGALARVEIEGLELHGRLTEDGRLELAGLELAGPDAGGGGLPALPWPQEVVLRSAAIELATPWGLLQAPLAGELRPAPPEATFRLEVAGAELVATAGRLRADLVLDGRLPLDAPGALPAIIAAGQAQLAAEGFLLAGVAEGIDGTGALTLALDDGRLDVRLTGGELRVAALAPPLAALREALPPPWRIALAERGLRGSGELAGATTRLELDGALELTAGAATLSLDLACRLAAEGSGRLSALGGRAGVALRGLRWQGMTLEQGELELAGEGAPEGWQGTLDLALTGGGQATPAITLEGAALRHHLALGLAGRSLTLRARAAGELALARLALPGQGEAGPLRFALPPQAAPLLTASLAPDGAIAWQHELRATGQAFEFALTQAALRGRAEPGALALALAGDQDGLARGRIALAGGRLSLPAQQLTLAGIAGEATLAAGGLAPGQTIPLAVETISHGGTPAWFAPLALRGSLRPGADALAFDARLSRPDGAFTLALAGRHELASGRGRATLELAPVTFAPGQLQPARLSPALGDLLREVAGSVALAGPIRWGDGAEVAADLRLLLEELAFTAGPASFSRVNGVVALDRLWPPTTPPGQLVAIGLLDLGLPLTRGLVAFELQPGPRLAVERLRWDFAGGTVSARPFTLGSAASDIILTLGAERLDLGQLFALTELDGLSGEGTISGTLPVRISGAEAVIEHGELRALGPGWLRYRTDGVPAALQQGGENVNLLLQALENFRYDELRITLDGRTDAEMDIGLHVKGANPDLYDGYPIEFNLAVEGELANILRSGLASYQIPERIRERMQGFRR